MHMYFGFNLAQGAMMKNFVLFLTLDTVFVSIVFQNFPSESSVLTL